MSDLQVQLRRALSLSLPIFMTLSSLSPYAQAAGAASNTSASASASSQRRVGAGFDFSNPTTSDPSPKTPSTGGGTQTTTPPVSQIPGGEKINLGELVIGANDPTTGSTNLPTTPPAGSDGPTEPGINLGNIPGRTNLGGGFGGGNSGSGGFNSSNIPANNPYAPWTPLDSYGAGRPGMLAIPQTMVPGIVCPLVDNRPSPEIVQAIDQLFQYVIPTGNCRSETDQSKINDLAKRMRESGVALKTMYGDVNSGAVDANNVDLVAVQGNIQALVGGIDTLGQIIRSSPLSGSTQCGQSGLSGGELLKSVGSLITSIAPYALLLASIGTGGTAPAAVAGTAAVAQPIMSTFAKPALKYLLGTFAVGSVASMYGDLITSGTMDMQKPDQREALLQNLCEYFRIEQRVTYLKQADMGNIRNINERLKIANQKLMVFKAKTQASMEQSFPKEVLDLAKIEDSVNGDLSNAQKIIRGDKTELADIKKARGKATNNGVTCALGKMLARKADNPNIFPGRSIKNYQDIIAKQVRVTTAQELLLETELELRDSLKKIASSPESSGASACAPGTQCKPNQNCADIANDYVDNMESIIEDGNYRIGSLKTSMTSQLSESPGFKEFKSTQTNIKREIQVREKTGRLVAMLAGDNAATVREEIDGQMDILKKTLFNTSSWSPLAKSPVYAWLDYSNTQYRRSLTAYADELNELYSYAKKAVVSKAGRYADYAANTLSMINTNNIKAGTQGSREICKRLTNLTLEWHTSINHLKSQKFFCDSIRDMMDVRVQKPIKTFCFGDYNPINGAVYSKSTIESNFLGMGDEYGSRARLIDTKYKEMQCEVRDATEVMAQ